MNRYDDLSPRATWFLNNFDEIDLADICASQEASNRTRQAVIDRVRDFCSPDRNTDQLGHLRRSQDILGLLGEPADQPKRDAGERP